MRCTGKRESAMKTVILLMLFAIAASLPLKAANARSPDESVPTGELIYYPQCGSAQGTFTWLLCDAFEG
jgi:hypothetical protein